MQYLLFVLGVAGGAGALYLWQSSLSTFPRTGNSELQLRIASLEETVGYLTMKMDQMQVQQPAAMPETQARGIRPAKPLVMKDRGNQIKTLAAQGLDAHDISCELGIPRGQVDLVLRLFGGDD